MAQYCRYCDHMQCGGASSLGYCPVRNRLYTPEHLAHTNDCAHYLFNPIDALRRNAHGYRPRLAETEAPDDNQCTIFDILEE